MKVDFWQLSRDPVEKVVTLIARRVLGEGERLLVVASEADQRQAISKALWKADAESFLANGEASAQGAEHQPVLLSHEPVAANEASHVIFADGEYREAGGFARSFLLFGDDNIEAARATWRALDDTPGLERAYFAQEDGKWTRKA